MPASGVPLRRLLLPTALAGGALVAPRVVRSAQWRFARMGGWSIATPGAAAWITDFLNGAYYARAPEARRVDDLRLAYAVLTTRWHRLGHRRLHTLDVAAFHRAFGGARLRQEEASPRGTVTRAQLLDGAARLLGGWFPDAYADPARRGWGIAFETVDEKAAFDPAVRLRHAELRELTPPGPPHGGQEWHAYDPVPAGDPDALVAGLLRPETWPDYATDIGRFTPVRRGGLEGTTFEIEVVSRPLERLPVYLRAYVSATRVLTAEEPGPLRDYVDGLEDALARYAEEGTRAVPVGAEPLAVVELTTHEGHFLGRACTRLVVFRDERGAWLRDVGTWEELRWDLEELYEQEGQEAQQALWGGAAPAHSLLHQMAERAGGLVGAGDPPLPG